MSKFLVGGQEPSEPLRFTGSAKLMGDELRAILQAPDAYTLSRLYPCVPALALVDFGGLGAAAAAYDELVAKEYAGKKTYGCLLTSRPEAPVEEPAANDDSIPKEPPSKKPPVSPGPATVTGLPGVAGVTVNSPCEAWAETCLKVAAGKSPQGVADPVISDTPTYEALCSYLESQPDNPAAARALTFARIAGKHLEAPRPFRPSLATDIYITFREDDFRGLKGFLATYAKSVGRIVDSVPLENQEEPRLRRGKVALALCFECSPPRATTAAKPDANEHAAASIPYEELPRACMQSLLRAIAKSSYSLDVDALVADLASTVGSAVCLRIEKVQGVFLMRVTS